LRHRLVGQAYDIKLSAAVFADMHLHIDFPGLNGLEGHGMRATDRHPAPTMSEPGGGETDRASHYAPRRIAKITAAGIHRSHQLKARRIVRMGIGARRHRFAGSIG
jgi:hypothetical protein